MWPFHCLGVPIIISFNFQSKLEGHTLINIMGHSFHFQSNLEGHTLINLMGHTFSFNAFYLACSLDSHWALISFSLEAPGTHINQAHVTTILSSFETTKDGSQDQCFIRMHHRNLIPHLWCPIPPGRTTSRTSGGTNGTHLQTGLWRASLAR